MKRLRYWLIRKLAGTDLTITRVANGVIHSTADGLWFYDGSSYQRIFPPNTTTSVRIDFSNKLNWTDCA